MLLESVTNCIRGNIRTHKIIFQESTIFWRNVQTNLEKETKSGKFKIIKRKLISVATLKFMQNDMLNYAKTYSGNRPSTIDECKSLLSCNNNTNTL